MTCILCATPNGLKHVQCKRYGLILKLMSMHKKDSKGIVKSNFITSCFTFKGLILTITTCPKNSFLVIEAKWMST